MSDGPRALPATINLSPILFREIGRAIVAFASVEWLLSRLVYRVLGVSEVEGRLAVREPRSTDRFDMLKDLLSEKGIRVDADFLTIREALSASEIQRNQFAHGLWLRDPDTNDVFPRVLNGQWQPIKNQKGNTKRIVSPQGLQVTVDDCKSLVTLIDTTITALNRLYEDVDKALASP